MAQTPGLPIPQPQDPAFAATPAPAETSTWSTPQAVATLFEQACLKNEGQAAAVVDWALAQGFEPADALRGNTDGLLAGQPGSVLAAPGSARRVLLVAAQGQQCTVWVEQMAGPPMRLAAAEALGRLGSAGARVKLEVDRNIERAGAWRNQMQWRYRAVGVAQEYSVGAVTTLGANVGTQALNLSPARAAPAYAPDGVPLR